MRTITDHLELHWRSKHFIATARYMVERYNGKFPDRYDELKRIPGVGDYIAGAIMTVCFNKPVPVVNSSIARFLNRCWNLGLKGETRRKKRNNIDCRKIV